MHALRTAILEHTTADGVHHDWLIEDPTRPDPKAPDARLWTARVAPPPQDWPQRRRLELTAITPHRRNYLTYQGPVPGNRGRVRRLASGTCDAKLWTAHRIVLAMKTESIQIELQLVRQSADLWLAPVLAGPLVRPNERSCKTGRPG
ncbi:MAG: hypothetical protein KTR15_12850 [Phycisphaeraceae bacterium]|nr:hypothetical protein [Phycisphaeraceae bacterium]